MMVIEGKEAIVRVDWQRVRTIIAEAGRGVPEVQIAERASVARMTVRKALGK